MIHSKFGRSFDDWAAAERAKRYLARTLDSELGNVTFHYVAEFSPKQLDAAWFRARLDQPWYATPTWLSQALSPHVEGLCAITDDSGVLYLGSVAALVDAPPADGEGATGTHDEVLRVEDHMLHALRQGQTLTAWCSPEKDPALLAALTRTHHPTWTTSP